MDECDKPAQPGPRLVAVTFRSEQEQRFAMVAVRSALCDLTANLLRVVRGAGKSYQIVAQLDALVKAFVEHRDAFGHWPDSFALSQMLSTDRDQEWRSRLPPAAIDRLYAEERIVRGALQITASRLLGQSTQERAGESEMHDGIRDLRDAQEEDRRERMAAYPVAPLTSPRRRKKPTSNG